MIMWGVLVFAGNVATYFSSPLRRLHLDHGQCRWTWRSLGRAVRHGRHVRTGVHSFDLRVLAAFLLFFAFGFFCCDVLGHFTPRQLGTFWPIYFMLIYCMAGLWFGRAFIAIGLAIIALTLIGYFFIERGAFPLWMAFVNGGGLDPGRTLDARD